MERRHKSNSLNMIAHHKMTNSFFQLTLKMASVQVVKTSVTNRQTDRQTDRQTERETVSANHKLKTDNLHLPRCDLHLIRFAPAQ